jgi:hypothetical protein
MKKTTKKDLLREIQQAKYPESPKAGATLGGGFVSGLPFK